MCHTIKKNIFSLFPKDSNSQLWLRIRFTKHHFRKAHYHCIDLSNSNKLKPSHQKKSGTKFRPLRSQNSSLFNPTKRSTQWHGTDWSTEFGITSNCYKKAHKSEPTVFDDQPQTLIDDFQFGLLPTKNWPITSKASFATPNGQAIAALPTTLAVILPASVIIPQAAAPAMAPPCNTSWVTRTIRARY